MRERREDGPRRSITRSVKERQVTRQHFTPSPHIEPYRQITSHERRLWHWNRTNGRCWYCGDDLPSVKRMCLDHVVTRRLGGSNEDSNLVPSCGSCNSRKHHRDLEQFRAYERQRHVEFTNAQESYLETLGVILPPLETRPQHVFAFEREGWV